MSEIPVLRDPSLPPARGLVVTDLDGTLLRPDRSFSEDDLSALEAVGEAGYARAIATGRSLYSYEKLLRMAGRSLPVDSVVFGSGSGIAVKPSGEVLKRAELDPAEVAAVADVLRPAGVDFMVHDPVPDSHRFATYAGGGGCDDYRRRLEWYRNHHRPLDLAGATLGRAAQFLVIVPAERGPAVLAGLAQELPSFNLIRTTSPLDHESTWIEIFPPSVSKGRTVAWMAAELGLGAAEVLAVGNDYNDEDLLLWAGTSYVVENAPEDLRARFTVVPRNEHGGVARAIELWLETR